MRPTFPVLLFFGFAACALAAPPAEQFVITQNGKQLGQAEYTTAPSSGGTAWTSSGQMKLNDFAYAFHSTALVDGEGNLVRDELSGSVHGKQASGNHLQFNTASDPTGRSFQVTVDTDGKQTTNTLDRHRNLVLLPDLDPAAYTLMARLALRKPDAAWVLIPKENGLLVPAEYTDMGQVTGKLNGQPVQAEHIIAAYGGENSLVVELYARGDGTLMEADLNAQNFRVERTGWKLANHPQPVAPPPGEAPQQNTQAPQ